MQQLSGLCTFGLTFITSASTMRCWTPSWCSCRSGTAAHEVFDCFGGLQLKIEPEIAKGDGILRSRVPHFKLQVYHHAAVVPMAWLWCEYQQSLQPPGLIHLISSLILGQVGRSTVQLPGACHHVSLLRHEDPGASHALEALDHEAADRTVCHQLLAPSEDSAALSPPRLCRHEGLALQLPLQCHLDRAVHGGGQAQRAEEGMRKSFSVPRAVNDMWCIYGFSAQTGAQHAKQDVRSSHNRLTQVKTDQRNSPECVHLLLSCRFRELF